MRTKINWLLGVPATCLIALGTILAWGRAGWLVVPSAIAVLGLNAIVLEHTREKTARLEGPARENAARRGGPAGDTGSRTAQGPAVGQVAALLAVTASGTTLFAGTGWFGVTLPAGARAGENAVAGIVGLIEVVALLLVLFLAVRRAPVRQAWLAGVLLGAAVALWPARFLGFTGGGLLACAFWAMAGALSATVGLYLRALDAHRVRSVALARREQRLALAADLHDYVAHDLSEMVALAQAGQFVPAEAAPALFEQVEQAGIRALASMDRTVGVLHSGEDQSVAPVPDLADLPATIDRFARSTDGVVDADLGPVDALPREVTGTAYRIVVEGLTNIRRHAPHAGRVRVSARVHGRELRVAVTDDGGGGTVSERRGGLGLVGLTARVEALGGTLTAGPDGPGWRIAARLPVGAA
ncbi:sensor histidine kinase [Longispora fulva]|uniref:histidine kinase n=1 Tax=Longispora fulva TaxID=619741 RepID=A0A8J7GA05_9ACTN|nr:ATP-binding protein [Longispora fulva]MBG6134469.1 signal transduction histidine kinase [Longispora fulva]